jgi:hypothetical protein
MLRSGFPPENKKEDHSPRIPIGVLMAGLKIQIALRKGLDRHLVILLVTLKYYEFASGLTSSTHYLFTRLGLLQVIQTKKLLPMRTFGLHDWMS